MIKVKLSVKFLLIHTGWISAALYITYTSNFFRTCWEDPLVDRFFFDIALICIGINLAVMLYVTVYLPYIARVEGDLETHAPKLIPIITICGFIAFVLYFQLLIQFSTIMGLWPVYSFKTPIYIFVMFMGYSMLLMFLPSGLLGSLIFWVAIIIISFFSHLIPHAELSGN